MNNKSGRTTGKAASKKFSDTASASRHRDRQELLRKRGFLLKKVFFGSRALEMLRRLYDAMGYEKEFDANSIDPMLVGDVLSFCLLHCYNELISGNSEPFLEKITAPLAADAQLLYRYHQIACFYQNEPDVLSTTEDMNSCNKKGKPNFPHRPEITAKTVLMEDSNRPVGIVFDDADDEADNEYTWMAAEIQKLADKAFINQQIQELNKQGLLDKPAPITSVKERTRQTKTKLGELLYSSRNSYRDLDIDDEDLDAFEINYEYLDNLDMEDEDETNDPLDWDIDEENETNVPPTKFPSQKRDKKSGKEICNDDEPDDRWDDPK